MLKGKLSFYFLILGLLLPFSFVSAGTVLESYKYSWSNNVGYINFENVVVSDSTLSGYAWSKTHGWIKFNPAQGGVLNDGSGNLSGYAWGEQLGWINFDNVSINTATGRFSGTATGTLIGTLTFDCPNYCDVRTDWRPSCSVVANASTYNAYPTCGPATCNSGYTVSGGSCVASGGGGGGVPSPTPAPTSTPETTKPRHIETNNQDLTIDLDQSGRYTKDTDKGQIVVEIPTAGISSKTTFYIETEPLSLNSQYLVLPELQLMNSYFCNVYAKDQAGNFVHSFSSPLTITLPIPINLQTARNLGVYWLNETNNQWVLIPDAVFTNNKTVFQVDHLTRFAIFGVVDEEQAKTDDTPSLKPSLPVPPGDESKNITKPDLDQESSGDEKPETIIEKIKDFFDPIIPGFIKNINVKENQDAPDNKNNQPLTNIDNQSEQSTNSKSYGIFLILLFLVVLLWIFKKYRDRDKKN